MSTLHTNDAPTTLTRLLQHGRRAVQHRLQRAADHRAAAGAAPVRELQGAGRLSARGAARRRLQAESDLDGTWKPYRAVGCSACNNGYKGRVGIYQVMPITEEIQRIILARRASRWTSPTQAASEGVRDLRQSGLLKVRAGVTTLEEVHRGHQRIATDDATARSRTSEAHGNSSSRQRHQGIRLRVGRQGQERQGRARRDARRRRGHGQRAACAARASWSPRSRSAACAAARRSSRRTSPSSRASWRR